MPGPMSVKVYALSTCPFCRMTREFLSGQGIDFDLVEVDLLEGEERDRAVAEVRRVSGQTSFPVVVSGEDHVVGYDKPSLKALLGL